MALLASVRAGRGLGRAVNPGEALGNGEVEAESASLKLGSEALVGQLYSPAPAKRAFRPLPVRKSRGRPVTDWPECRGSIGEGSGTRGDSAGALQNGTRPARSRGSVFRRHQAALGGTRTAHDRPGPARFAARVASDDDNVQRRNQRDLRRPEARRAQRPHPCRSPSRLDSAVGARGWHCRSLRPGADGLQRSRRCHGRSGVPDRPGGPDKCCQACRKGFGGSTSISGGTVKGWVEIEDDGLASLRGRTLPPGRAPALRHRWHARARRGTWRAFARLAIGEARGPAWSRRSRSAKRQRTDLSVQ